MNREYSCDECIKGNNGKRRCNILEVLSGEYDKSKRHQQCPINQPQPTSKEVEEAKKSIGNLVFYENILTGLGKRYVVKDLDEFKLLEQALNVSDERVDLGFIEKDFKQILYTLKYASKARKQIPREVFQVDEENVGKPDYMAFNSIKTELTRLQGENEELKEDRHLVAIEIVKDAELIVKLQSQLDEIREVVNYELEPTTKTVQIGKRETLHQIQAILNKESK